MKDIEQHDGVIVVDGSKLSGEAMPKLVADFQSEVVGQRIVAAGYYKFKSEDVEGAWPALLLANGTVITASRDDECNGPGVLMADQGVLCETDFKE
jgi:hypothetical protein